MRQILMSLVMVFSLASVSSQAAERDLENILYLDLKDGRVTIQMYPAFAPNTVERIKKLTREGFYDGLAFHRVLDGFMAQTGDPLSKQESKRQVWGSGGSSYPDLEDEFNIKRHWRGVASMANSGVPNSANSQFFIMFKDNTRLDGNYTVWGRVIAGMKHVDKIKRGDEYNNGAIVGEPDRIVKMVVAADVEPKPEAATEDVAEAAEN